MNIILIEVVYTDKMMMVKRFAFFSKAALEILPFIDYKPDILNANDWHTSLSIIY